MKHLRRPILACLGGVALAVRGAAADAQAPSAGSGVTASSGAANAWTPPRTPWGDPDLQGFYTNKYEQGTPFERPDEFEGRRPADIQGEELAAILRDRQDSVFLGIALAGGDPAGNLGGPLHWQGQPALVGHRPARRPDSGDDGGGARAGGRAAGRRPRPRLGRLVGGSRPVR